MKYMLILFFSILPIFSHTMEQEPLLCKHFKVERKKKKRSKKEYAEINLHKMNNEEKLVYVVKNFREQKFKAMLTKLKRLKQ